MFGLFEMLKKIALWCKGHPLWSLLGVFLAAFGTIGDAQGVYTMIAENWDWLVGWANNPFFPWLKFAFLIAAFGLIINRVASKDISDREARDAAISKEIEAINLTISRLHGSMGSGNRFVKLSRFRRDFEEEVSRWKGDFSNDFGLHQEVEKRQIDRFFAKWGLYEFSGALA